VATKAVLIHLVDVDDDPDFLIKLLSSGVDDPVIRV
jgi:hypothetical protein